MAMRAISAAALILSTGGCSSIIGIDDGIELSVDAAPADAGPLPDLPTVPTEIFVSGTGDDSGAGTQASPFRSISRAVQVAAPNWTIFVGPGTYDEAGGETFPINFSSVFAPGLRIIGDETGLGADRVIQSTTAPALIELFEGELRGFTLSNAADDSIAVDFREGGVLSSCTVAATGFAVFARDGTEMTVTGNLIEGSDTGLFVQGTTAVIRDNQIINNRVGVEARANARLDGGNGAGNNTLSCNTDNDLNASDGTTINADGNLWDHAPPTEGVNNEDILATGGTIVSTNDAALAANPCP